MYNIGAARARNKMHPFIFFFTNCCKKGWPPENLNDKKWQMCTAHHCPLSIGLTDEAKLSSLLWLSRLSRYFLFFFKLLGRPRVTTPILYPCFETRPPRFRRPCRVDLLNQCILCCWAQIWCVSFLILTLPPKENISAPKLAMITNEVALWSRTHFAMVCNTIHLISK